MSDKENKGNVFLDILRAQTRVMKTVVQTMETHTKMLEAILEELREDDDE